MLDAEVFGNSAVGPHVVNLAIHVGNACLLLFVLAGATRAWWRSAIVAALFAFHPLRAMCWPRLNLYCKSSNMVKSNTC